MSTVRYQPLPGPQEQFSACEADIAIYGGSAGGGKTFALLMEAGRWFSVRNYRAVLFRRTLADVTKAGGLWDKGAMMYRELGASIREGNERDVQWPNYNSKIQFRGCEQESDVHEWQGAELDFIGIDEADHFTAMQVWYLWTRCRSTTGIRPYMRLTVNPNPDSYIRELIAWWIGEDGFVIESHSGVIRWVVRDRNDQLLNFGTKEEAQRFLDAAGDVDQEPTSLTFIRSKLSDNPALTLKDPKYRSRIAVQDAVTRAKLLDGNWNARASAGALFNRAWFQPVAREPDSSECVLIVRGWDFAFSAPTPSYPNPDWSATVKVAYLKSGRYCIMHVDRVQLEQGGVDQWVRGIVQHDGPRVVQCLWQDPAGGKALAQHCMQNIRKACISSQVEIEQERLDKIAYASIASAAIDPRTRNNQLLCDLVINPWGGPFLSELEAFPGKTAKKDQVDAMSRAFLHLDQQRNGFAQSFMKLWSQAI